MFNLYEIVQNAQDGQAIDNLAKQFNISPRRGGCRRQGPAAGAVDRLPDSERPNRRLSAPFSARWGIRSMPPPSPIPTRRISSETTQKGAAALQQLFGSPDTSAQIAQHAAGVAGLPPALIQQMAPVIASLILGGLSKGLANQGLGGVFGQLAGAAGPGGLGSILGSLLGGAPAAQAQPAGGAQQVNPGAAGNNPLDGLGGLGSILGGLLGGAPPAQAQPQGAPQANPQINPDAPGGAGGLGALGGVLQSILGGLLGGKPGGPAPQEGAAPQGARAGSTPARSSPVSTR